VLAGLSELVKAGELSSLKVVNIEQQPELAAKLGVRSVPWVRIGPFELLGLRTLEEFRDWARRVGTLAGMTAYLVELLSEGNIRSVLINLRRDPSYFAALIEIMKDPDAELNARVAIGAVMEDLHAGEWSQSMIASLGELTRHADARTRSDACHYLGLSGSQQALPYIRILLGDSSEEVREIAQDTLELLKNQGA